MHVGFEPDLTTLITIGNMI